MKQKHATTLVTVTYGDRLAYLRQLVERSLASPQVERIVIVSNASSAPLEQLLARWPEQIMLVELGRNTGSAVGYGHGLRAALEAGAEYVWMMDDDNAPVADALDVLHRTLERLAATHGRDGVAVLGFRPTQQADIAAGVPSRYAIQPPSSYFGFHLAQLPYKLWRRLPWGRPAGTPPALVSLPFAPYGGMLAHRSLYQRIGVPLPDLVLYVDDTEYTRRITAGGGHLYLVTEARLEELETSWNVRARRPNVYDTFLLGGSDLRAYYSARNQAWFDRHRWAASKLMHGLNRAAFLWLLRRFARRRGAGTRLALLERAIREGETGRLGADDGFPLA